MSCLSCFKNKEESQTTAGFSSNHFLFVLALKFGQKVKKLVSGDSDKVSSGIILCYQMDSGY